MGKQYNKGEKRKRRVAYLKRKTTNLKKKPATAPVPAPAPAPASAPAA